MTINPENAVVALCAAGMAVEGDRERALELFERAWRIRQDDYDASIAAHFLARVQPTAAQALHWNELAVRHAELVTDGRTAGFFASLFLNLADSYVTAGRLVEARTAAVQAALAIDALTEGGYRDFVERGIRRVQAQLERLGQGAGLSSDL